MSSEGNRRHHGHGLIGRLFTGRPRGRSASQDPLLRDCPECAESVYVLAERCRYCGSALIVPTEVA